MVRGVTNEPAARLATEADAKSWLDQTAMLYAAEHSLILSQGTGSSSASNSGGVVMNSEEFDKYKNSHDAFVNQHVELYMRYLGKSTRDGNNLYMDERERNLALQSELDSIAREHGEKYVKGIRPVFDVRKARHFDSAWNWVRQDAKLMYFDIIFGRLTEVDRDIMAKSIAIMNRADPSLLNYMTYHIESCNVELGDKYRLAKDLATVLLNNCKVAMDEPPRCKDVTFPTAPSTEITAAGEIKYSEVNRPGVRKLEAYVKEMAAGSQVGYRLNMEKIQQDISNLYEMVKLQPNMSSSGKEHIKSLYDEVARSLNIASDSPLDSKRRPSSSFISPIVEQPASVSDNTLPFLHLKRNLTGEWNYSKQLTCVYLDILTEIATSGSSFEGTNALLTGCGRGSIGAEVLKGLLSGGCKVVVTTSSYSRSTVEYYQHIYQVYGSRGSKLVVVPFNQASKQDCITLIDYIYSPQGLNMDLDYVVPFAAISENGREVDGIDDVSELAHRLMLTNLIRLIGSIKSKKQHYGVLTRPTQIVLPQSPNHGTFGGDGLYAESKIGLEPLFNKWKSESWSQYISLVGAVIGWTRVFTFNLGYRFNEFNQHFGGRY
jgi:fatty acid synthase subunit alpha, fungi type